MAKQPEAKCPECGSAIRRFRRLPGEHNGVPWDNSWWVRCRACPRRSGYRQTEAEALRAFLGPQAQLDEVMELLRGFAERLRALARHSLDGTCFVCHRRVFGDYEPHADDCRYLALLTDCEGGTQA